MSYLAKMERKMEICPFNKHHRISGSRIQYHIIKCMKNYPNHLVCPYNASHRILKDELNDHLSKCIDKRITEAKKTEVGEYFLVDSIDNSAFNLEYENWSF